jgi:hypothetical protein
VPLDRVISVGSLSYISILAIFLPLLIMVNLIVALPLTTILKVLTFLDISTFIVSSLKNVPKRKRIEAIGNIKTRFCHLLKSVLAKRRKEEKVKRRGTFRV